MEQENIALVRRWFEEAWNQRRAEALDEILHPESVCHMDDGPMRGPQEFRVRQYEPLLAAFSELHVRLDAVLADGDHVVARWTATGRHTGEGLGFPPTGQTATFRGISWIKIRDGQFIEGWQHSTVSEGIRGLAVHAASHGSPR